MSDTTLTPAKLVSHYIQYRDQKRAAEKALEAWLEEEYEAPMRELERTLLETLNQLGVDSLAARGVGTVYKKMSSSVTVADTREFQRHVIGTEAWDLLDWRANKTAVNDLVEKGEPVPPGINRTTFLTVGIRKN